MIVEKRIRCDKCRQTVTAPVHMEVRLYPRDGMIKGFDLCAECAKRLKEWMEFR